MNSLMLCEGKTDAILLSYYLKRVYGWQPMRKGPAFLDIQCERNKNQEVNWYKRDEDYLLICSVGGNRNFGNFFRQRIKSPIIDADGFQKIVIVTDRDTREKREIEETFVSEFNEIIKEIKDQTWVRQTITDAFKQEKFIDILLIIVPENHQGALESLLLDAISEDPYDAVIVRSAKIFVHKMRDRASKYISSDRLELKSQLNATWAIQSPDKVFDFIDEQINAVAWERSDVLKSCFQKLALL